MKYSPEIVIAWFKAHNIDVVAEHRFAPPRRWRFDFAVPVHRIAIEVQGGLFTGGRHSRGPALMKEHEKLNTAAAMGWRVLYTIPQNICMSETIELVKQAMAVATDEK